MRRNIIDERYHRGWNQGGVLSKREFLLENGNFPGGGFHRGGFFIENGSFYWKWYLLVIQGRSGKGGGGRHFFVGKGYILLGILMGFMRAGGIISSPRPYYQGKFREDILGKA